MEEYSLFLLGSPAGSSKVEEPSPPVVLMFSGVFPLLPLLLLLALRVKLGMASETAVCHAEATVLNLATQAHTESKEDPGSGYLMTLP